MRYCHWFGTCISYSADERFPISSIILLKLYTLLWKKSIACYKTVIHSFEDLRVKPQLYKSFFLASPLAFVILYWDSTVQTRRVGFYLTCFLWGLKNIWDCLLLASFNTPVFCICMYKPLRIERGSQILLLLNQQKCFTCRGKGWHDWSYRFWLEWICVWQ